MLISYLGRTPTLASSVWAANSAEIIGDVSIKSDSSIWFQSVIRGDFAKISIGAETSIQDGCILHTDAGLPLTVKDRVTVAHGCILHSCTIEDECLIGMGAIVLNNAVIGRHSIIGAGAVVTENMSVPEGSLVVGCPAKVIKQVSDGQIAHILENAAHYCALARDYQKGGSAVCV